MKKIMTLILAASALGAVVASCSSAGSSPGKAAKQYAGYIADGEYDKLVDVLYYPEDTPAKEVEEGKAFVKELLTSKGASELEEKGGLKSAEVTSETVSEDGLTATVEMLYTYGNGETSEEDMTLRKSGGKWLIDMEK
jgi:hypothetical protein